jgi:CheY-like chemotaxis protein
MSDRLIVVVEDDEDDFFFTQRELRKCTRDPILHLDSGRAAIDYLDGKGAYHDRTKFPPPDVMFLDLKMDHVSGLKVLDWMRSNLGGKLPQVYVLTGSNEPRDRARVKNSGVAAGYFVKPLTAANLVGIFGALQPA